MVSDRAAANKRARAKQRGRKQCVTDMPDRKAFLHRNSRFGKAVKLRADERNERLDKGCKGLKMRQSER